MATEGPPNTHRGARCVLSGICSPESPKGAQIQNKIREVGQMNVGTSSSTAEVAKRKESDCPQATGSGSWGKRTTLSKREPPSPPPLTSENRGTTHKLQMHLKLSCLRGRGWGWMGVLRDDDESHNLWTKKHFFCLLKVLVILPKGIHPPSKAKAGRLCFLKHVTLTPPWRLRG